MVIIGSTEMVLEDGLYTVYKDDSILFCNANKTEAIKFMLNHEVNK